MEYRHIYVLLSHLTILFSIMQKDLIIKISLLVMALLYILGYVLQNRMDRASFIRELEFRKALAAIPQNSKKRKR